MTQPALNTQTLIQALDLLGKLLERASAASISLVICGGSSLIATGLNPRATKDVDIVAFYDEDSGIRAAHPLPASLVEAALSVADELGFNANWLNNGPQMMVNDKLPNMGLPDGFVDRLHRQPYGQRLTIYFIDRLDQIYFKLFAAADKGGPSYHLDDLIALAPTADELEGAAQWAMIQDPSPAFADTLVAMLNAIGYEDAAQKL
ncbi:MAG: hypothetical protein QNJ97_24095 [Myxococcota bacterium]|nr:hypothetical protein [Myxococcota bacterium]